MATKPGSDVPRTDWIMSPALPKSGFVVRIKETTNTDSNPWNNGIYENVSGLVTSVTISASSTDKGVTTLVSVQLREGFSGTRLDVPHRYIKEMPPWKIGEKVIAIGGPLFGQVAAVREFDTDVGNCMIEVDGVIKSYHSDCLTVYEG
jgi:hypothetical protein